MFLVEFCVDPIKNVNKIKTQSLCPPLNYTNREYICIFLCICYGVFWLTSCVVVLISRSSTDLNTGRSALNVFIKPVLLGSNSCTAA